MSENMTSQTIDVLNQLIETCKDSEAGFKTASEEVKNAELSALCMQYSQQRSRFALELQEEVSRLGEKPKSEGSVAGSMRRGWENLKSAVAGRSEDDVIAACEEGEDQAKASYEKALKAYLPAPITTVLQRQFEKVKEGHDRFSAMEKAVK